MTTTSISFVVKDIINDLYLNDELNKLYAALNSIEKKSDDEVIKLAFIPRNSCY